MNSLKNALFIALTMFSFSGNAQVVTAKKPVTVVILLYPGVEVLDFSGPLEIFSAMETSRVVTVAAKPGALKAMNNSLTITPDYTLANCPQPDILVVPGAPGEATRKAVNDTRITNWIQRTAAGRQLTMSVCTGAFVLAKAGLVAGKTVTTHWGSTRMLQQMYPTAKVMENTRYVEDGSLLTTAGVSAGIDGALRVVEKLRGVAAAQSIAELIAYDHYAPKAGLIVGQKQKKTTKAKPNEPKRLAPTPLKPMAKTATAPPLATDGIDPVCQMTIAKGTAQTMSFGGKQYGFCSGICLERFSKNPTKYTRH